LTGGELRKPLSPAPNVRDDRDTPVFDRARDGRIEVGDLPDGQIGRGRYAKGLLNPVEKVRLQPNAELLLFGMCRKPAKL
jgi:hypothetical protein